MTPTASTTIRKPSIVTSLRAVMPRRPLHLSESLRLAELQTKKLLEHCRCQGPPFNDTLIESLPNVVVRRVINLPAHGITAWEKGRWQIRIRGADTSTRQRFTLAHELKHLLDASLDDIIYSQLPNGSRRDQEIEVICNHFAACLLMPKMWLRRAWTGGMQDIAALAWYFDVSPQAMQIRLQTLGLIEQIPQHTSAHGLGAPVIGPRRRRGVRRYYRSGTISLQFA